MEFYTIFFRDDNRKLLLGIQDIYLELLSRTHVGELKSVINTTI